MSKSQFYTMSFQVRCILSDYRFRMIEDYIDECGPWIWPEQDQGAWLGPKNDWKTHKETIGVLKQRRTAVQAGGCCGMYPILLSKIFDKVLTFEPVKENFYFLERNVKHQNIQNVVYIEGGLAEAERSVSMRTDNIGNVGMHHITDATGGDINVLPLDLITDMSTNIDLIWFDMEGYEQFALAGARETIKRNRPLIGLERPNGKCLDILNELDYDFFTVSEMDSFFLPKEFKR